MKLSWYFGKNSTMREIFKSSSIPIKNIASSGQYIYVIGPFKTKRGAQWCLNNHYHQCETVSEMEIAAKRGD